MRQHLYVVPEPHKSSLASRAMTTVMIRAAEGLWAVADSVSHAADALERAAERVGDTGSGVLNWWTAECERRGW